MRCERGRTHLLCRGSYSLYWLSLDMAILYPAHRIRYAIFWMGVEPQSWGDSLLPPAPDLTY